MEKQEGQLLHGDQLDSIQRYQLVFPSLRNHSNGSSMILLDDHAQLDYIFDELVRIQESKWILI